VEFNCQQLAQIIDYALLGQTVSDRDVEEACRAARHYGFASVYVKPYAVARAVSLLEGSSVAVGTVLSFPLGGDTTMVKLYALEAALRDGAREFDLMTNLGAVKAGNWAYVAEETRAVVQTAAKVGGIVKVIVEAPLLSRDEKVRLARICAEAGADFVKTSSGFAGISATVKDVQILRGTVGVETGVKASGGIRTLAQLKAMVDAGADRIGTSVAVPIVDECARQGGFVNLEGPHRLGFTGLALLR